MDKGLIKTWDVAAGSGDVKRTTGLRCWAWFERGDCDAALQGALAARGSFGQGDPSLPVCIGSISIGPGRWRARNLRRRGAGNICP